MNTRINIIQSLIEALQRVDGRSSPWDAAYSFNVDLHGDVYLGYNDDINTFPHINILIENENIYSIGGGERFSNLQIELRCYTLDEDVEFSGESISEDVEHTLDAHRLWGPNIEDLRIAQIETDGGINAPYGAAIIKAQVLFRR